MNHTINSEFDKARAVVKSCKTMHQLVAARKYIRLFNAKHVSMLTEKTGPKYNILTLMTTDLYAMVGTQLEKLEYKNI